MWEDGRVLATAVAYISLLHLLDGYYGTWEIGKKRFKVPRNLQSKAAFSKSI